jgi:hypothetical protein
VLALITGWGIKSARDDARRQLAASYRPVLVPLHLSGERFRFRGGEVEAFRGPQIVNSSTTQISLALMPVVNIGTGPALNARGTFTGPGGQGKVVNPTEGIAAGERGVVVFENRLGESLDYGPDHPPVSAELEYDDVAGTPHRTSVTYNASEGAYESTVGDPPKR